MQWFTTEFQMNWTDKNPKITKMHTADEIKATHEQPTTWWIAIANS